jgi:hypothetical protein
MSMKVLCNVKLWVGAREDAEAAQRPFLRFWFLETRTVIIIACAAWKSGKPAFGFPLFHPAQAGAVGMWKSRRFCEISKGRWKGWETAVWFSTLSTGPAFPRPSARDDLSRT